MATWNEDNLIRRFREQIADDYYYSAWVRQEDDSWKKKEVTIVGDEVIIYEVSGLNQEFVNNISKADLTFGYYSVYLEKGIEKKTSSRDDDTLLDIHNSDDLRRYCEDTFGGNWLIGENECHNPSGVKKSRTTCKRRSTDEFGTIIYTHKSVYVYRRSENSKPQVVIAEIISANEE